MVQFLFINIDFLSEQSGLDKMLVCWSASLLRTHQEGQGLRGPSMALRSLPFPETSANTHTHASTCTQTDKHTQKQTGFRLLLFL